MILETTDGGKYGMRHMSEMWLQVYEVAFAKDAGLAGKNRKQDYIYHGRWSLCI